jgi:hypothetical protein
VAEQIKKNKRQEIINDDIYLAISLLIIYLCVYEWSVCQSYVKNKILKKNFIFLVAYVYFLFFF